MSLVNARGRGERKNAALQRKIRYGKRRINAGGTAEQFALRAKEKVLSAQGVFTVQYTPLSKKRKLNVNKYGGKYERKN